MQGDGAAVLVALVEVLALEDAGDVELAHEAEHLGEVERLQPLAVVDDGGAFGIEHLHSLLDVGLGVGLDLFLGEGRAGGVAAGRIADQRGAVADDEGYAMAEVLELAHLAQRHGMAEVQVGGGGVDAELDVQRHALGELRLELLHRHDLHGSRGDDLQLFFNRQQRSALHLHRRCSCNPYSLAGLRESCCSIKFVKPHIAILENQREAWSILVNLIEAAPLVQSVSNVAAELPLSIGVDL